MRPNDPMTLDESPRTFREAFVVYCRQASVRVIALFLVLTTVLRVEQGAWTAGSLVAFALSILGWPLLEWTLHRYALHARPRRLGPWVIDPFYARKHREHHAEPWVTQLTFLPIAVPLVLAPLLLLLGWYLPDRALAFSALMGLGVAALNYEWTHWIVHTRVKPQGAYYQQVFRNHRMHHFRHEDYWFSFAWPPLDRWLGTGPEPESVTPSGTARDLSGK